MYQGLCLEFETAGAVCSIEESSRVPICGFPAAITSDSKNGDTLPTAYSRKCVTVFLNQTILDEGIAKKCKKKFTVAFF